jgi:hypothetical protein
MDTTGSVAELFHHTGFELQVGFPTIAHLVFGEIAFGKVHEQAIMTRFAHHKGMVETPKVCIAAMQGE